MLAQLTNLGKTSAPATARNPTVLGRISAATAARNEGHRSQVAKLWLLSAQLTDIGKTNGPMSARARAPWRVR